MRLTFKDVSDETPILEPSHKGPPKIYSSGPRIPFGRERGCYRDRK